MGGSGSGPGGAVRAVLPARAAALIILLPFVRGGSGGYKGGKTEYGGSDTDAQN